MPDSVADRLAARTLELIDVPSESNAEAAIAALVSETVPLEQTYADEETMLFESGRTGQPLIVLAGHLDTVPAQGNIPGRIENGAVVGLGASDMKGGLAVMVELARWIAADKPRLTSDVAFLFFPREEIAVTYSPLPKFFATGSVDEAALVLVLEPTDNTIQAGCVGNVNVRVRYEGISAHSARPWLGVNAIGLAFDGLAPILRLEPHDVEIDGLVFREVLTPTVIQGGIAENVVPGEVTCTLNFRYAPTRTPEDAIAQLGKLLGDSQWEVLSQSPAAHVAVRNPLVERLRATGDFEIEPKQAWTPVAQFAERGLDAVNLGPGATRYAHKRDEQVETAELVRTYETLQRFFTGAA